MADQVHERHSYDSSHQRGETGRRDSLTNPNIFSDDFALEPFPTASDTSSPGGDGVSPSSTSFSGPRSSIESHQPSSRTQDRSHTTRSSFEYGGFSPSSSRDSRPLSQSFNYALGTEFAADGPKETSRPHRSISSVSNFSMPRTQSPYQGATGPSHPYGMYPQDIGLARSSSSATHSTVRMPDRSYAGPMRPSQPYGMYSQSTVPEDETTAAAGAIRPAPGFPGLAQTYRRRFVPGGEEAEELVGPDGYTEQLPPYTRYPNNVPPKNRLSALPGPAGETGDPNRNPANESRTQTGGSQDTLNASHSADGTSRNLVADESLTQLNSPPTERPQPTSEGGHFKERVKEKGQRRVCWGTVPMWFALTLTIFAAVLLGAVVGGVLGRLKARSQHNDDRNRHPSAYLASDVPAVIPSTAITAVTATTTTTLIDAVPFTSSVSLPPLHTGVIVVNLSTPTNMSQSCLTDSEQQKAWDCSSKAKIYFNVDSAKSTASISYNPSGSSYRWGPQPPIFEGSSSIMVMKDKDDLSKGPAYYFQHNFDKIVVLKEHEFDPQMSKRSLADESEREEYLELEERGEANVTDRRPSFPEPADKAWFCFWNGTILEAFIFTALEANTTSPELDYTGGASDSSLAAEAGDTAPVTQTDAVPPPPPIGTSVDIETITSPPIYPTSFPSSSTAWRHKRRNITPPNYPILVKLEERRHTQIETPPYCQKMQIMNDGSPSPLPDESGQPNHYPLNETEPENPDGPFKTRRSWLEILSTIGKRDAPPNIGCQCQWQS
ncbi:hypothetical protein MMC07_009851 [Pseudocyphellaria aurata]|nr:hypothetical protein [Pseudocyphellaria aurata]